ncbi:ribosome-binding factor A [Helicobacter monodelphidis]|uniref:30S ribosome-binding factor RbfA n=1 Tax=Helicobacter sp. 15-1451 TaxID=2004995 RepID=UPI000DCE5E43|nr:30S ribosome-binding factor RbfA [Helicobacter sp. 15-1451]RAX58006.1 ribosome-binding factor A [Helicobacter sp. 15-1451]
MKEQQIRQKRFESLLLELINEGFCELNDSRINGLVAVRVEVSRGKYDAQVFLDSSFIQETEKKEIQKRLKIASGAIRDYCLQSSGWFRCPKLHFAFDNSLKQTQKLDALFAQIEKEREGRR